MTIASKVVKANPKTLQELTDWCIEHSIEYPAPIYTENGLVFACWRFSDNSRVRFDDYFHELREIQS